MEIKINREIREYTESIFFGLSLRQFVFSVIAVFVAVGSYFVLKPYLGTEIVSWICIFGAAPFAVMGFVRYNGMTAERFVRAWMYSEFIIPKKLTFQIYDDSSRIKSKRKPQKRRTGGNRNENAEDIF